MIITEQFYFKGKPHVMIYSSEGSFVTNGKYSNTLIITDPGSVKEYYEMDPGKSSMTPDQAWKIIESSNISKENKVLLKDFIYKEG